MASTDARPIPQKNVAYRVTFPILDADGDLVTGATALDSEVSKDAGTFADCTNEATEIATASGMYYLDLTSTEMNADCVAIIVKTSTTGAKTVPIVLYPEEAGDIRVNATQLNGTGLTGRDIGASVLLSSGSGTGQLDFTSGVVKSNLSQILGTALTETAGLLAGGFKKFFNVSTPTGTLNSIPDAVAGATGGLFIAGTNAATTVTTALTTTFTGNVTGSVGSVTGAVGSVTGAVGSVTGNVGGNVVGSVASVTAAVALTSGERNSVADAILDRDMSTGADNGSTTVRTVRQALRFLRNKWAIAAGTLTVYKEDDANASWTASVSTDAAAIPIIGNDPAGP